METLKQTFCLIVSLLSLVHDVIVSLLRMCGFGGRVLTSNLCTRVPAMHARDWALLIARLRRCLDADLTHGLVLFAQPVVLCA